jgi:hypothetical protein
MGEITSLDSGYGSFLETLLVESGLYSLDT